MATHEDAALIIQLQRWGTELGLDDAVGHVFSDDFDPDSASTEDAAVSVLLSFGETLATLVKHQAIDRELVLDLWWVEGLWTRVAAAAAQTRQRYGESRLYENFEKLATRSGS